jgi:hypothetical protein
MAQLYVLSVAYDDWSRDKSLRGSLRVNIANKVLEEILAHTPDAHITRLHNDAARYDSIRAHLGSMKGKVGPSDYFWLQYNGHGSNMVFHCPIDLLSNWDGKGEFPFVEKNTLMDETDIFSLISGIAGMKIVVMDSCYSDTDIVLPADTVYVAASKEISHANDMSTGVIHPTLSRYSVAEIVANGAYMSWDGLEYKWGEKGVVRANIVSPQFLASGQNSLPSCRFAQDFYEKMTGETDQIYLRFFPRRPFDPGKQVDYLRFNLLPTAHKED